MSLQIKIEATDAATPVLNGLLQGLTDKTGLHAYIAAAAEAGTRQHVRSAAAQRHGTAAALGAKPTGYLEKRAELVQSSSNANAATVTAVGAIFRRVLGPVTVRAKAARMLTIPWRAEAYGKRAREFTGLFVFRSGAGQAFLARREGSTLKFYFLLKRAVVLPQDRGLLPTQEQYAQAGELAARGYLRKRMREMGLA